MQNLFCAQVLIQLNTECMKTLTNRGNMHIIILTDESRLMIKSLISMQTYQNLIGSTNFILNDSVPVFGTKTSNSTLRNLAFTQGRHSNEHNRARTLMKPK